MGDLRRTFGGPLDQLTRLWFENFVDSIGGVNPALAWVYDQRGRLKSDTSFTGSTARATSFAYDTFERPSTRTDALGTWTTRYESDRGYADTLITPFADTVTYTFDARDRAVGPYVSSGTQHARVPSWNASGALRTLTNSVTTSPSYVTGKWDRKVFPDDPLAALGPVWTEQHGSGAGVDSLQDSLAFDGWERLTSWVGFTNGTALARDTFRFDRVGNIQTTAGAESYDVTTGRLLSRTDTAGTWSYTYDRAGNLVQAVQGSVTWVYGYDALNRLRSARQNGAIVARYAYDVAGRRIAKRATTKYGTGPLVYTRFVYRGANVAFETDSAGTIGLRYTWGPAADDLVAIRDAAGNHYYVVQDKLRSVRGLVQRDGTWIRSRRFGPYGAIVADTSSTALGFELRYRWTGREFDVETGWYYFRARYYDPAGRRFVQEDPIGEAGGENGYAYVGGNPVDRRDPSGLEWNYDAYATDPRDSHLFGNCWSTACDAPAWTPGEGFGGGFMRLIDERWERDHPTGDLHMVTVCRAGSCTSIIVEVKNRDFDPSSGNQLDLIIAGAHAAIYAGASSFRVSSFTAGHAGFASPHNRGAAMDVSRIDGEPVQTSSRLSGFLRGLMSNTTLPNGSQVMGPGDFGFAKEGGSWDSIDMSQMDTRRGSPFYGMTLGAMHQFHIHVTWGRGYGVPAY